MGLLMGPTATQRLRYLHRCYCGCRTCPVLLLPSLRGVLCGVCEGTPDVLVLSPTCLPSRGTVLGSVVAAPREAWRLLHTAGSVPNVHGAWQGYVELNILPEGAVFKGQPRWLMLAYCALLKPCPPAKVLAGLPLVSSAVCAWGLDCCSTVAP